MASLQDFYLKLDGISGESKDSKHSGWIDILSFSYSVSQSASNSSGGGSGVGKASFGSVSVVHYIDRATPNLMQYAAAGKHIAKAQISANKVGDGSQEYLLITLENVLVTSVGINGSTGDARVQEVLSLSYEKIKIEVKEQNADGSLGATVTGKWNVKANSLD